MSFYQGSLLLGSSFGPTLGGLIGDAFGFRAVFFAYSALALLAAAWAYSVVPETRAQAAAPEERGARAQPKGPPAAKSSAWSLLADPSYVLVSLVTLAIFFTRTGSRSTVLPLYGSERLGLGPAQLGFSITLMAVFNLLTINWSGVLADKLGRKAVIVPSCIVSGAALWAFSLSGSYAFFLASGVALGIGTGLAGPAPAAYVADLARPGQYGLTMGLYRTFGDVGVSVGPILLGWLSDQFGFAAALRTNALMFAVAGLAFGFWARETMKRTARSESRASRGDVRS
ncbi:MAG: MFS transporter, partial [Chloroflexi bacterium]|nr:MFS transporter [Chloroflexota bacterium]